MPIFTDDNETRVTPEAGGNALPEDMPFRLLLIGDWSSRESQKYSLGTDLGERKPIIVDRDNFEEVMRRLNVELALDLYGDGADVLRLRFEELDDFHPDKIFHQVPLFASLRDTRKRLMNADTFNSTAREFRAWLGGDEVKETAPVQDVAALTSQILENQPTAPAAESGNFLDQILSQSGEARENRSVAPPTASRELNALLGDLVRPFLVKTDETEQSNLVAAVDNATGELMRKILHHPQFQALESAWRGVYLLVSRVETDSDLKLYLLDATKDELKDDLKSVSHLSDSAFCKLLSEPTPGNYVDETWAAVFGNYIFSPDVEDIAALMRVAQICADSDTPFIAQASPKILGIESLADTPDPREWRFSDEKQAKLWAMLREMPEAQYVGLTIPRTMMRMPYGEKNDPTENFSFEEFGDAASNHDQYLWGNSIFACALLLAQSFRAADGWEIERLVQDIDDLPMHIYKENGETKIKPGAELVMTQAAAERIMENGLMPLISYRDSDRVRLARLQSINSSKSTLRGKWSN